MTNIQREIPHQDLAMQIDCAHEFSTLEEIWRQPGMERQAPWWTSDLSNTDEIFNGVIDRIVAFAGTNHIASDVEFGLHFCYGDFGHKHFIEPKDMSLMVRVAKAVFPRLQDRGRRVDWIHMPVPKERDDEAYLAPLRDALPILREQGTELYLGLVREGDEEGTKRRVETARKVVEEEVTWGVATECGMGRTPRDEVGGLLDIMKKVARPVR